MPPIPSASRRCSSLKPSLFSSLSLLAAERGAVNLGQGIPNWPPPPFVLAALGTVLAEAGAPSISSATGLSTATTSTDVHCRTPSSGLAAPQGKAAFDRGAVVHQYALPNGVAPLRAEVAKQVVPELGDEASTFNADDNVLVTNGCQEGIRLSLETCLNPGDTCVVIEPHFDTYVPDARLAGALVSGVPLHHTGDSSAVDPWYLDLDELSQTFEADRPKVFFFNNPHNPTGHVFTDDELTGIAQLCRRHNVIAISDEIYDRIVFSDSPAPFRRLGSYPGMANRTLTLSSFSKTGSTTGWKVGWAVGPKHLVNAMTMMSMYTAYAIASPLQYAVAEALRTARKLDYYTHLSAEYQLRRDLLCGILRDAGYEVCVPGGAYFAMTRHTEPGFDDVKFCYDLIDRLGVAAIPASWLTTNSAFPNTFVRWSFCKTEDVLEEARRRLVGK